MFGKIDLKSKVPLYFQLANIIIYAIESGSLKYGEQLWTEFEFCSYYQVSRATIRQAMTLLIQEEYVYRKRGLGTFVLNTKMKQNLVKIYSFTESMNSLDKHHHTIIVALEKYSADTHVSLKLKCAVGESLWRLHRIRFAENTPVMVQEEFFLCKYFVDLDKKYDETQSLYQCFREQYQIIFDKAEEYLQSVAIDLDNAKFLQVEMGAVGTQLERILYYDNIIIGYGIGMARGDQFIYKIESTGSI